MNTTVRTAVISILNSFFLIRLTSLRRKSRGKGEPTAFKAKPFC